MQTINKKGLTVKDLVTVGIFSALFLVFALVGGIFFAPNPVLTFYMPVGSALLCGPVYLLMLSKVQKRWAASILGALLCIVWFVTGMHWAMALGYLVMGIIADLIAGTGGYKSKKINSLSYILLSLGGTASYLVFFADPDGWAKTMLGNGNGAVLYRYDALHRNNMDPGHHAGGACHCRRGQCLCRLQNAQEAVRKSRYHQMKPLHLDPRTKLLLILLCVLSAMAAPSLYFQFTLVALIGLLSALSGRWQCALRGIIAYALICA